MIRIWGRIPFQPSGHPPPPIRPEEPYWQRLFQQQLLLQQQQTITAKQKQHQVVVEKDGVDASKLKSSAMTHSANIHSGLVREQATKSTSASVPISTGAESISIWGTGPSDDTGGSIALY